jgi:DNA-binding CsgD family transcriptional regulator
MREVEAGRLASGAVRLLENILALDEELNKMAMRTEIPWDGTVVVKDLSGRMSLITERVVSVADSHGRDSGFHVSWWLPTEKDPPESLARLFSGQTRAASLLTARQLEIARWYAAGLNSRAVAEQAGITLKTARDHLEEIYSRLDLHSRAELSALLVREGLM